MWMRRCSNVEFVGRLINLHRRLRAPSLYRRSVICGRLICLLCVCLILPFLSFSLSSFCICPNCRLRAPFLYRRPVRSCKWSFSLKDAVAPHATAAYSCLIPAHSDNSLEARDAFRCSRIAVFGWPKCIQVHESGEWEIRFGRARTRQARILASLKG